MPISLTHNGTSNNSAPHADSREMVFDANGDLIETDDGGVYRQTDPSTTNGVWQSLNGNLQVSEHHSCDYDSVGNLILCGDQDTGAPEQSASGSTSWVTLSAGDGGFVAVNDSGANSVRFSSSNSFGSGSFLRRVCTAANVCINSAPGFNVVGPGPDEIQAFDTGLPLYTAARHQQDRPGPFHRDLEPRLRVHRLAGQPEHHRPVSGIDGNGNPVGTTRAIAYGGRAGGADNVWRPVVRRRPGPRSGSEAAAPAHRSSSRHGPMGPRRDIVLNPENWADAYVSTGAQVFHTTDAGASFTDVTGNLGSEAPAANVRSLEIVPVPGMNVLAAVRRNGYRRVHDPDAEPWSLGRARLEPSRTRLPTTCIYDATDDVLLVPTMGRGAWLVNDISDVIPIADVRVTKTGSPDPVIAGEELFYTVTVTNDGPDKASGVMVVDNLPDEVVYLSDNGWSRCHLHVHRADASADVRGRRPGQRPEPVVHHQDAGRFRHGRRRGRRDALDPERRVRVERERR